MRVVPCTRCRQWERTRCAVYIGAEHLPLEPSDKIPTCPMQDRCQHELQAAPNPCPVRARGMICESALRWAGIENPEAHPLAFHADTVATPEDWAEYVASGREH